MQNTPSPPWTLLLVDDHALFRSGLRLILQEYFPHALIQEADSLAAAVLQAVMPPDVILLDVFLDGESGISQIPQLRHLWPGSAIVVVTSDDRIETRQRALDMGASAFLQKSSPPDHLIAAVRAILLPSDATLPPLAPPSLTPRQMQILDLLRQGKSNKAIANLLGLSEYTVRGHVQSILKALGVQNRSAAVFEYQRLTKT